MTISSVSVFQVDGQGDAQSLLLGEWFKYNLCVDFPTMDEDRNIVVEMFTNDPDNSVKIFFDDLINIQTFTGLTSSAEPGKTALSLEDISIMSYGSNLKTFYEGGYINASSVPAVETKWYHDTGGDQVCSDHKDSIFFISNLQIG